MAQGTTVPLESIPQHKSLSLSVWSAKLAPMLCLKAYPMILKFWKVIQSPSVSKEKPRSYLLAGIMEGRPAYVQPGA